MAAVRKRPMPGWLARNIRGPINLDSIEIMDSSFGASLFATEGTPAMRVLERVTAETAEKHPDGAVVPLEHLNRAYVLVPHAMTPAERAVVEAVDKSYIVGVEYLLPSENAIVRALAALRESRKPKPRFVQFQTNAFKDTESGQFYDAGRESYRIVDLLNELHAKAAK